MKLLSRIMIVTLLALGSTALPGQDQKGPVQPSTASMDAIVSLIGQLRSGDLQRFRIEVGADSFQILKSVETPLTEEQAASEVKSGKPGIPSVRFTRTQELLCISVAPDVWIEQAINTDKNFRGSIWSKRTMEKIGSYPMALWDTFAGLAMENGLSDFAVYGSGTTRRAELAFDSAGPGVVRWVTQSLTLPRDFYRTMRISTEFRPSTGRNGFVVLIHDPHQSVSGRFALMQGLHSLLGANPRPVEFLVEGAFPESNGVDYDSLSARELSDGGLAQRMKGMNDSMRLRLIYSMLSAYLIDTPLAYRILYDRMDIHSFAIDDNHFLHEGQRQDVNRGDVNNAFRTIVSSLDGDLRRKAEEEGGRIRLLSSADTQQISDIQGLLHAQAIASSIRSFVSIAQSDPAIAQSLDSSFRVLKAFAQSYDDEADRDERALKRNKTMLKYIEQEAARAPQRLPVAFIGSYHTQGIVEGLRNRGIGYVVIEPRLKFQLSSQSEDTTFDSFLVEPDGYFASVAARNKGLAGLTSKQVEQYHVPFMAKEQVRLSQKSSSLEQLFAGHSESTIDRSRIKEAVMQNASLNHASVEIGGGGAGSPPDAPRGAFAFFDESEGKPRLVLLGSEDDRWHSDERYACLGKVILDLPKGGTTLFHVSKHYQDEKTGRVYYTHYDRKTKRLYLVESSLANAGSLLSVAALRRNGVVNIHVVVTDLIPGEHHVEQTDAGNSAGMVN
jgi:hypothetical protein